MKRRIAAGLVALVVAIVVWRTAARSATSAPIGKGSAAAIATAKRKPDPRSQAHATVTGRITAAGKPVAHAHVCADTTTSLLGVLGRDAICTDTDATGGYQLADLYATDYRVAANARGFRPAVSRLHLDAGMQKTVDLALPAGGVEVSGTVSDIAGGPISHAQLRSGDAVAETDDAGKFSMWLEPGSISVEATADGYAPSSWNGQAPDHVELQLTPESSLSGTVLLPSGEPLADAQVEVAGLDWRQPTIDVTSSEDGTFHADRLAPGRYSITVRSAHAYGTSAGTVLVALAEHTDGIVISVVPAFQITGTLTTADGSPCTDGSLRLTDDDHARSLWTSSDSSGAIELGGVLPGIYHVSASCSGFISHDGADLEIRDKDVSGKWSVEAGATVRGKVTMRDGTPVEGAELRFQGAGWGAVTTAADGSYHLAGLAAGSYTITASSVHGFQNEQSSLDVPARATVDHDLVLEPAASLKGVVVDGRGAAVAGAYVHFRDVYGNATTGADGTFMIGPVIPGDHELVVELADRVLQRPGTDPDNPEPVGKIAAYAGETATVRLVVDIESAEIRGVVVDATGAPARDVVVELSSSTSDGGHPALTGDDGAFRFPAVRGAHYRVRAYSAGRGEAMVNDAQPGEPLHLQLTNTELSGVVRGAPDELTITISGQMWRTETFFRTGGAFTLHDLRPGSYNIVFDTADGHTERTIELGDTPAAPLDITLDPVFTLTGRIVAGDTHAGIANTDVQFRMGSQILPDSGGTVQTDGAGRFTLKRAHIGHASVRISGDAIQSTWLDANVTGPALDDLVVNPPAPPTEYDSEDYSEE